MYVKRAITAYQTTVSTTTPMLDTMIELLNEMGNVLQSMQNEIKQQPTIELSDPLKKLQYALFELMAVVDHQTEEGERLFLLYVLLNQTLVSVQLYKRYELLPEIYEQVNLLSEAWTEVRQHQRLQRYQTDTV